MLCNAGGALLSAGLQLRLLHRVFQDDAHDLHAIERVAVDAADLIHKPEYWSSTAPALPVALEYHRVAAITAAQQAAHVRIEALLANLQVVDDTPSPPSPSTLSRRRLRASLKAAAQQRAEVEAEATAARARSRARVRQRQLDAIAAAQQQRAAARQQETMYVVDACRSTLGRCWCMGND